jgi:molybdopterin-guanine dinucleotide biosynthesis protein B
MVLIRQLDGEMGLDDIVGLMGDLDLVITEGYKRGDKPKIEVTRLERGTELLCQPDELIGIMTDYVVDLPVPRFALDDAAGVVDLLEQLFLSNTKEGEG